MSENVDKAAAWDAVAEKNEIIRRQKDVIDWVESWISNPVGSYSVAALDGLFAMTRDRIAELQPSTEREG